MKKLVCVDWGNVIHKAIFAFRNNSQIPVSYTIFRMIIGYLKRIGIDLDTKIIICEDFGSWRKEIDGEYKRQRKAFREGQESADWWAEMYKESNEFTKKLEECLPWNFVKIYKMESDDIASAAVRFIEADEKILVSTDEDWQMLCTFPNVKIFSPKTKKYKIVEHPEKILLKKIHGDRSDNLLTVPQTEAEYEKRKMIVNLIELPQHIDNILKPVIESLPLKNLHLNKVPFYSCREQLKLLYKIS